jgi:hypothetical protein
MMSQAQSAYERFTEEEFARRGDEIYEQSVRPRVGPDDDLKFVAIDVETGAFEVDAGELAAIAHLTACRPDAAVWLRRVGRPYAYRFGARQVDPLP